METTDRIRLPWPNAWEFPAWALVPNLEVLAETEKALLLCQGQKEDRAWVPKAQISFEIWAASRFFVGMTLWIAKKKSFVWEVVLPGEECTLEWLEAEDRGYERRQNRQRVQREPSAQLDLPLITRERPHLTLVKRTRVIHHEEE